MSVIFSRILVGKLHPYWTNEYAMKPRAGKRAATFAVDPLPQASRKYSTSPLIDPAVCSLVQIAPSDDFFYEQKCVYDSHWRKNEILVAAAQIIAAPIFFCHRAAKSEAFGNPNRTFACEAHGCIWKNQAFLKALDAEDRSAVILFGYWLDCEVAVAALCALADCYDVYVPLDASPGKSREAARLTELRLLKSGATPLLTEQVLREWAIEASCAAQRAALMSLIK
jgi:nicotinamidase-related amidase